MEDLKRFDRLVALLIHLQSRKIVKAKDLSDRFDVSLRTIYRDVRSLMEAGVPIGSEAGVGYYIMEGYNLPPVMFSKEEATTFLLAEKVLTKYADPSTLEQYSSALFKIKSVLRSGEKEFLENVDKNLTVVKKQMQPGALNVNHSLDSIINTINSRSVVRMSYQRPEQDGYSERDIEPLGILLQNTRWYLVAWCLLRADYRSFRVDRIKEYRVLDGDFSKTHPDLNEILAQNKFESNLTRIVIRVDDTIPKYIDIQKQNFGFESEQTVNGVTEMTFHSASIEGFARWYLMFADHAEIVSPVELSDMVELIFKKIAKKF